MSTKGAGVIIYDRINDAIVIVKGNQDIYSFPKGHKKRTESMEECAVREIHEETGLIFSVDTIKQCNAINVFEYTYYIMHMDDGMNTLTNFNVVDHREINSCNWYTITELLTLLHHCNQGVKKILMNWNYYKQVLLQSETSTNVKVQSESSH